MIDRNGDWASSSEDLARKFNLLPVVETGEPTGINEKLWTSDLSMKGLTTFSSFRAITSRRSGWYPCYDSGRDILPFFDQKEPLPMHF
jgi:hypothetical protein